MNASIISALAALAGAAIGGFTSVLASWLNQRIQARTQWLAQDKIRRQELYKEFIETFGKCYADALQHNEPDIPHLVGLFTTIARMRVLSSPKVLESAEQAARKIFDTYPEPNKTFDDFRAMASNEASAVLRDFADTCRAELESLGAQQFS